MVQRCSKGQLLEEIIYGDHFWVFQSCMFIFWLIHWSAFFGGLFHNLCTSARTRPGLAVRVVCDPCARARRDKSWLSSWVQGWTAHRLTSNKNRRLLHGFLLKKRNASLLLVARRDELFERRAVLQQNGGFLTFGIIWQGRAQTFRKFSSGFIETDYQLPLQHQLAQVSQDSIWRGLSCVFMNIYDILQWLMGS